MAPTAAPTAAPSLASPLATSPMTAPAAAPRAAPRTRCPDWGGGGGGVAACTGGADAWGFMGSNPVCDFDQVKHSPSSWLCFSADCPFAGKTTTPSDVDNDFAGAGVCAAAAPAKSTV